MKHEGWISRRKAILSRIILPGMTDDELINILKRKGIYITVTRITVLRTLVSHIGAIGTSDIQRLTPGRLDRVSVYRTLQLFLKKGLIETAPGNAGWPQYFTRELPGAGAVIEPGKIAGYFICKTCGTITTAKVFNVLTDFAPAGYQAESCQVVLKGKCNTCLAAVPTGEGL